MVAVVEGGRGSRQPFLDRPGLDGAPGELALGEAQVDARAVQKDPFRRVLVEKKPEMAGSDDVLDAAAAPPSPASNTATASAAGPGGGGGAGATTIATRPGPAWDGSR